MMDKGQVKSKSKSKKAYAPSLNRVLTWGFDFIAHARYRTKHKSPDAIKL